MKYIVKNIILKKFLIVLITLIMLSNFIMPNYVCASVGDDLVEAFFHLLAFVGDIGIKTMQKLMMNKSGIGSEATGFKIKYSPGIIFANEVPSLDINFISPKDDYLSIRRQSNSSGGTIECFDQDELKNMLYEGNLIEFQGATRI